MPETVYTDRARQKLLHPWWDLRFRKVKELLQVNTAGKCQRQASKTGSFNTPDCGRQSKHILLLVNRLCEVDIFELLNDLGCGCVFCKHHIRASATKQWKSSQCQMKCLIDIRCLASDGGGHVLALGGIPIPIMWQEADVKLSPASHYSSYIELHQSYCSSFAIKVSTEARDKWGPGKTTRAKGRLDASRKRGGQSRGQDNWILGSALPSQLQHDGQDHLAVPASSSWIPLSSDEPTS